MLITNTLLLTKNVKLLIFFKILILVNQTYFNFPIKSFLSTFLKYFYQSKIYLVAISPTSQSIPGLTRFITSRYLEIIDCCSRG